MDNNKLKNDINDLENKYEVLFKKMLNGFALHKIITDESGKPVDYEFVEVNESFEKMTGLKKEDIIGSLVTKIIPDIKNDSFDWIGRYGDIALNGKEDRFESFSAPFNKWFSIYAYSPLVGYFATIFEDITEQKTTAEELKKQNLLMKNILENAPIGFAVNTISDGKVVFVSNKFKEIYGIEDLDVANVDDYFEKAYLDPVFREELKKRVMGDIASGDPARMKWENIPITTSKGEKKFITAVNIPIIDQNIMVSTVQDVTKQDVEEEALLKSEEVLKSKIEELEKFNKLTVNREMTMIELKNKVEELEKELASRK